MKRQTRTNRVGLIQKMVRTETPKQSAIEYICEQLGAMEDACDTLRDGFYHIKKVLETETKRREDNPATKS